MPTKIAISRMARREITLHRQSLLAAVEKLTSSNGESAKLEKRLTEIETAIPELESGANPSDKKAVQEISALRVERDLIAQRLNKIAELGTPSGEELVHLLTETGQVIHRALTPALEAYEREIAAAIRPFMRALGHERRLAVETDALKEFAEAARPRFTMYGANITEARRALKTLDEILAGKLAWQFNPEAR
jgi:hypothetical protein